MFLEISANWACWAEREGLRLGLEAGQLCTRVGELLELAVQLPLREAGELVELLGLLARHVDVLVQDVEHVLVVRDLVGQGLVLLGEREVVAHLGQDVGEVLALEEAVNDRRPVSVVGLADPRRQEGLAGIELGLLGGLLGDDLRELGIEAVRRGVELVDLALGLRDLDDHRHDLGLDRQQVCVDGREVVLGAGELA